MIEAGESVVLAEFSGGQHRAQGGVEAVVVALGRAAPVVVDGVLGGRPVGAGGVVGGVAHAGGGQFGQRRFQGGAGFGGEPAVEC